MRALVALFSLITFVTAGCARPWTTRVLPPCPRRTNDAQLDRARSFYAAVVALDTRGYAITHADLESAVEASYALTTQDHQESVRWRLTVRSDAALTLDAIPAQHRVGRWGRAWADKLALSVADLSCRDLDWLRWEAQRRGLVAVGAPELRTQRAQEERSRAISVLIAERQAYPLYPPLSRLIGGAASLAIGASYLAVLAVRTNQGCGVGNEQLARCDDYMPASMLSVMGGVFLGLGVGSLSLGAYQLVKRKRRLREIEAALQQLREVQVGLQAGPGGIGVATGGRF